MKWIENKIWNEEKYQEYQDYLKEIKEEQYRDFHQKLTPTKYEILGIRVPKQRKIAKEILKTDIISFLQFTKNKYYEEVMIKGFVIASIKEEKLFEKELEQFLTQIDNWAICDSFCNSIEIIKMNPEKYFSYFLDLLRRKEPFSIRVGLIVLLNYYLEEKNLKIILNSIDQINIDHYYVNMGVSWLLAEIYIKYPKIAEDYFKVAKINDFTMNKTISKIKDSYRVSKEEKEKLTKYRRKK